MDEKEVVVEKSTLENEKGFSMLYNITLVSSVSTVIMFVVGTALYLAMQ